MNVLYSFNKSGREAEIWTREIAAASSDSFRVIPFNHGLCVDPNRYLRAQALDDLFYAENGHLLALYRKVQEFVAREKIDVLLVDNCPPYHPEFLRNLAIHKVLRICDGPVRAYDRDFAYAHAYDQVLYHSAAYSAHTTMPEKLAQVGARRSDFWPLALFDAAFDPAKPIETLLNQPRDIDVIFIGALHFEKMPQLAKLKKAFGRRIRMHGLTSWKRNLYFNAKFGFPGWITPIGIEEYIPLYQRSKIGINLHNRGKFTVGNYRLFDLPANGVMQVSDGGEYLSQFYQPGVEIAGYEDMDEAIVRTDYYLTHPREREEIARAGFAATMVRHRFQYRMRELAALLRHAMSR
jgi:spore maturation protein CgeB